MNLLGRSFAVICAVISLCASSANGTPLGSLAETPDPPCSATSPSTGTFVNLHALTRKGKNDDFIVRGHDYLTNFTLNICAPVLSGTDLDFHAIPSHSNVSAYYRKDGKVYSLGQSAERPLFRGRKLVLNYTRGSLCPKMNSDGSVVDGKDNEEGYRKSTLLSFTCDRELVGPATISFVGALNECSYFFDVRTSHACATIKQQPLGPVAIFGIIFLVALMVYFIGGCFYQRTVLHARGWRQLPHWQTWLGALNFIWDMLRVVLYSFVNLFNRLLGRSRTRMGGYTAAPTSDSRSGRPSGGRRDDWSDVDDENRLIDQLDDDWSDDERR